MHLQSKIVGMIQVSKKNPARLNVALNARFNVVARKESSVAIHNAFPPAVIILLDDVDYGSFVKCEFIVLVLLVTVDCNDCNSAISANRLIHISLAARDTSNMT